MTPAHIVKQLLETDDYDPKDIVKNYEPEQAKDILLNFGFTKINFGGAIRWELLTEYNLIEIARYGQEYDVRLYSRTGGPVPGTKNGVIFVSTLANLENDIRALLKKLAVANL